MLTRLIGVSVCLSIAAAATAALAKTTELGSLPVYDTASYCGAPERQSFYKACVAAEAYFKEKVLYALSASTPSITAACDHDAEGSYHILYHCIEHEVVRLEKQQFGR